MRSLGQRFAFLFLLATAIVILLVGRADPYVFDRARVAVTDFVAPLLDAMSRPAATVDRMVEEGRYLMQLREDNAALREDNARLLQWQAVARQLEAENNQLRSLLAYERQDAMRFVTARVIGDTGGPFVRSILVNEGSHAGIRKGQAAVVGEGLLGRVASVGQRSARVLRITDLNSRVPVVVESTRVRAVLAGDNSPQPRLTYLSADNDLAVGQRIVTSGHGGAFPPGLPVGVISSVGETGVRVEPFASTDRLEYVRLMDFGLHGVLDDSDDMAVGKGR